MARYQLCNNNNNNINNNFYDNNNNTYVNHMAYCFLLSILNTAVDLDDLTNESALINILIKRIRFGQADSFQ